MSRTVLIVDDNAIIRRMLRDSIEDNREWQVCGEAENGRIAVERVKELHPDIVILDLQMPDPDGFDLLKAEHSKFPYLRILVISGYLHGALLEAAELFGAIATLEKPITAEALVGKVREVLGR